MRLGLVKASESNIDLNILHFSISITLTMLSYLRVIDFPYSRDAPIKSIKRRFDQNLDPLIH